MNLRQRLQTWAHGPHEATASKSETTQSATVVPLPMAAPPVAEQLPADTSLVGDGVLPPVPTFPPGILDSAELKDFFAISHFAHGRHDGARYKSQEAMAQGRETVISAFQHTLSGLVAQRRSKVDALQNMRLQTQGVCNTTTAQLELAGQRLERDIQELQVQLDLAAQGKGWILSALNEYQMGFGKGVRDAVDAALLGL